jgi:predicted dienelactone hydrolase
MTLPTFRFRVLSRCAHLASSLALAAGLWAVVASGGVLAATEAASASAASAPSLGLLQLPASGEFRAVTVYYPSSSPAATVQHGPALQALAVNGTPVAGNGRLVVISHGTGGMPAVHANLARALVAAGFVVAAPEHRGDTHGDYGDQGTTLSLKRRPGEVSHAIDAVAAHPVLAAQLRLDRVGVYGMSAGGFTALALAGGRWSPAQFARHCDTHLAEDFQFCVGDFSHLTGSWLDPLRLWVARHEIQRRFAEDTAWYGHTDPRVAAIVAAVPAAAVFDLSSLATPPVPLALVTAGGDRWLRPQFHAQAVLAACQACVHLAHLPLAGHGAYLSPPPPRLDGVLGELLNDPPGFDRADLPAVDQRVVGYLAQHLLR